MSMQTERASRRKRKAPQRRAPVVVERTEPKPFIFGWGAQLNRREREALKERIALGVGILIAVVLLALFGWGWYNDNVYQPAQARAAANKPIAEVGNYTIRTGFFKKFETLRKNELSNNISQAQQQVNQLSADKKKNAVQLAQVQGQLGQLQQAQQSVATDTLTALIDDQTLLQRSSTVGVRLTPKIQKKIMLDFSHSFGALAAYQNFVDTSGLSTSEIQMLADADWLRGQVTKKVQAKVPHDQMKVRASHILVPSKKTADQLYRQILHGANFAQLAKKYSKDTSNAGKGGDLGYFARGVMVAPFDKAAFSMKVGQVKLVHTQYGWHILKVTDRHVFHLSSSEYSQQQQQAYQNWLKSQQSLIGVQRYVASSQLPGYQPPAPSPFGSTGQSGLTVPGNGQAPPSAGQVPPQVIQPGKGIKISTGKKQAATGHKK